MIYQTELTLPAFSRGFHIIDKYILAKLKKSAVKLGILHIFIKHTSAALAINEGADPSVRTDMEVIFNLLVPENNKLYTHTQEGADDMPAHAKAILAGPTLTIPITNSKLNLGIWQSIYLCEFRNTAHNRKLVLTIYS